MGNGRVAPWVEGVLRSDEITVGMHTVAKVALVHLEKITVADEIPAMALLLACLEIPLSTGVRLDFTRNALSSALALSSRSS